MIKKEDIQSFMIQWNNRFPLDRWWRKKHGIAFLSPEHKECSFLAQLMEYEEDVLINKSISQNDDEESDPYIPNIGEWIKRDRVESVIDDYDLAAFRRDAEMMAKFEEENTKEG